MALTLEEHRELSRLEALCEDGTELTPEQNKRYFELLNIWEAEQDVLRDRAEDSREDFEDLEDDE